MTDSSSILLFALPGSEEQGTRVAEHLGLTPAAIEHRIFESGEHKLRPLVPVRGRDVYLLSSLQADEHRSVHDRLCLLLFLAGTLGDAGADRITAIAPYLGYSRADRRTEACGPVTTRYIAQMMEAVGIHRIVSFDVHNPAAFENAFRCPAEQLEAKPLFVQRLAGMLGGDEVIVLSPDVGGMRRADAFRQDLCRVLGRDIGLGFVEKRRQDGTIATSALVGEVRDRTAVLVDDLISTGTTLREAARQCRHRGARTVLAAVTHGILAAEPSEVLTDPVFDRILLSDTVDSMPIPSELLDKKIVIVQIAGLVAEAIRRLNADGRLTDLLEAESGIRG
ncbi:ribose-phosphate diphosphokinase [Virgifigura deserti]|uniref:ribose-phosphate diphosphokinase n=1 Tax=Virgifigura deserti TaxID=2268457 RepID=UPI003CCBCBE9